MTNLTREQHAQVLSAYINRIPLKQLEMIVLTQKQAWHASLNLGANAQDSTQKLANEATMQAVRGITGYDLELIQKAIQDVSVSPT